jgi:hypothetical protein
MQASMQYGQSFELKTTGPGGQRLWAYRYRLDGRGHDGFSAADTRPRTTRTTRSSER